MLTTTTRASRIDGQAFNLRLSLGDRRLGIRLDTPPGGETIISGEIERSSPTSPCRGPATAFIVSDGRVLARDHASLTGRFALRFARCSGARLIVELPDRSVLRVDLEPLLHHRELPQAWLDRFDEHRPVAAETFLSEVA